MKGYCRLIYIRVTSDITKMSDIIVYLALTKCVFNLSLGLIQFNSMSAQVGTYS